MAKATYDKDIMTPVTKKDLLDFIDSDTFHHMARYFGEWLTPNKKFYKNQTYQDLADYFARDPENSIQVINNKMFKIYDIDAYLETKKS